MSEARVTLVNYRILPLTLAIALIGTSVG